MVLSLYLGHAQTFFERMYMGKTSGLYGRAVDNFVRSLAGYAIVTYMLQVRTVHRFRSLILAQFTLWRTLLGGSVKSSVSQRGLGV